MIVKGSKTQVIGDCAFFLLRTSWTKFLICRKLREPSYIYIYRISNYYNQYFKTIHITFISTMIITMAKVGDSGGCQSCDECPQVWWERSLPAEAGIGASQGFFALCWSVCSLLLMELSSGI